MNNPIINLEGVDIHQMEQQIFSNITLKISAGDFIYLVGETGSGKSSLLKVLYGEIKVSAGNITLTDIDLNKIKAKEIPTLRRKLGIVFQDFQLLSDRTVFENLSFVLKATGWKDKVKISERINEVLRFLLAPPTISRISLVIASTILLTKKKNVNMSRTNFKELLDALI